MGFWESPVCMRSRNPEFCWVFKSRISWSLIGPFHSYSHVVLKFPIPFNSTPFIHNKSRTLLQQQQPIQQTYNILSTMKSAFYLALILGVLCLAHAWEDDHHGNTRSTKVRFGHQCPDAPKVDVYVNGNCVWEGIEFRSVTEYVEVEGRSARVEVTVASTRVVVLSRELELDGNFITVAAVSKANQVD